VVLEIARRVLLRFGLIRSENHSVVGFRGKKCWNRVKNRQMLSPKSDQSPVKFTAYKKLLKDPSSCSFVVAFRLSSVRRELLQLRERNTRALKSAKNHNKVTQSQVIQAFQDSQNSCIKSEIIIKSEMCS